ncbi:MAG: hypothetical protein KDB27_18195 [Planctomycetales bacterium]|nr:hypothetical protein [Planctomycetales bacterium]
MVWTGYFAGAIFGLAIHRFTSAHVLPFDQTYVVLKTVGTTSAIGAVCGFLCLDRTRPRRHRLASEVVDQKLDKAESKDR